jgi:hypothetical protein
MTWSRVELSSGSPPRFAEELDGEGLLGCGDRLLSARSLAEVFVD